jgi:hypothetical protein
MSTSEIPSLACANHAPMCESSKEVRLVSAEAEDDRKHGAAAYVKLDLTEENKSSFEK